MVGERKREKRGSISRERVRCRGIYIGRKVSRCCKYVVLKREFAVEVHVLLRKIRCKQYVVLKREI